MEYSADALLPWNFPRTGLQNPPEMSPFSTLIAGMLSDVDHDSAYRPVAMTHILPGPVHKATGLTVEIV